MKVSLFAALFAALLLPAGLRAQQPSSQGNVEPMRLADFEAEALRMHPAIKASAQMVEAKRGRIAQARAWPDPQLSIGYMGDPAPFKTQAGDPSSYRQLGVMQEIPYPGKTRLRGEIAEKEVAAEKWNVESVRRQILAEVRVAYFDLWATDRAIELTLRNKDLLTKFLRIAEEKYKVGEGQQQDVLRAQVEISRIEQRLVVLRQRRQVIVARMNTLLVRPPNTPIGELAPVEKSPLTYTLDELLDRGVANSPEIRRQDELIAQSELAVNLAHKESYPDFSVGWDYQNRPGFPEMYGLRFGMNLPIFQRKKREGMVTEAVETRGSAKSTREAIRTELLWKVSEQYLAARTSDELIALYAKAVVPQSTLALESSLTAYQAGTVDFLSVITNFTTILDYETSYFEELGNYQKSLARLEEITGVPLIAPAPAVEAPKN